MRTLLQPKSAHQPHSVRQRTQRTKSWPWCGRYYTCFWSTCPQWTQQPNVGPPAHSGLNSPLLEPAAATTPTQSVQPVVPEPVTPHGEAELERSGTSATLPDQEEGDRLLPRRRNSMGRTAPFEGERKGSAAGDDFRDPIETVDSSPVGNEEDEYNVQESFSRKKSC